ncbi:MAG: triose-phosphate isomerase [Chloroflexi bacterium]|nr:triose-phosphate isomerase [Chloroflexota bacterium]
MRTPIIAGNWKMFKTVQEAAAFVEAVKPELIKLSAAERVVCPPYVAIPAVQAALAGTDIAVGAQDVHWEEQGAFTSQIAPGMLAGLVKYVIVGHSETREYQGVSDVMVNKKAKAALKHGLRPIIAVGESLAINEAGQTQAFVGNQIRAAFEGIPASDLVNIVVAYEPIWAIGTGKNASSAQANEIIGAIRSIVAELYGTVHADAMRIQYGGSVKPENMAEYMSQPHIDGALVGGASLKPDSFIALVRGAIQAKGLG